MILYPKDDKDRFILQKNNMAVLLKNTDRKEFNAGNTLTICKTCQNRDAQDKENRILHDRRHEIVKYSAFLLLPYIVNIARRKIDRTSKAGRISKQPKLTLY